MRCRALQKIYWGVRWGFQEFTLGTYGCETVVWRACEGDQVDFRGWLGDGHFA